MVDVNLLINYIRSTVEHFVLTIIVMNQSDGGHE